MREVRPRIVISNDMLVLERQHGRAPFLQFGVNGRFELFVIAVVNAAFGGSRASNDCAMCCAIALAMIGSTVRRIAKRVNVAGKRGSRLSGHSSDEFLATPGYVPGFTNLDFRITRILQKRR